MENNPLIPILALIFISNSILSGAMNKTLQDYIDDHNAAFKKVEPFVPYLRYDYDIKYESQRTIWTFKYQGPPEALKVWYDYMDEYRNLENQIDTDAFKNGLTLGLLATASNLIINGRRKNPAWSDFHKSSCFIMLAGPILLKWYQNKKIDPTPYFDYDLDKNKDLYGQLDIHTFGHMRTSFMVSVVTAILSEYLINEIFKTGDYLHTKLFGS